MKTTSKIKRIHNINSWNKGSHGMMYYHLLEMENGDKIDIGKKKECKVGWELTYEITGGEQQEYRKATPIQVENLQQRPQQKPQDDSLQGIKIGHAITNAVQIVTSRDMIHTTSDKDLEGDIKDCAKMILKIGEELNLEISKEVKVVQASPTSQEHPYTEANQQSFESLEDDNDDLPF